MNPSRRRNAREIRARSLTQAFVNPNFLESLSESDVASEIEMNSDSPPTPPVFISMYEIENFAVFSINDILGSEVSTCTIPIGEEKSKQSTHFTVEISSKPDEEVVVSTKQSSGRLPFPSIIDFKRRNNWEFAATVTVPAQESPMSDIKKLKKDAEICKIEFLKAAEDIKKGFLAIEKYAVKLAALEMAKNNNGALKPNEEEDEEEEDEEEEEEPIYDEPWVSYTEKWA